MTLGTLHGMYSGKVMLAPMVRLGTLPLRLLSLDHGADLVYSEEMIDKKVIGSERVVNDVLGTIDYLKKGKVIFRTTERERDRLIFQIGTADPDLALEAALTVAQDVAGIDVNCGCPKHFSVHSGMGAALLKTPDRLISILEKLVQHAGKPITCKIRIFKDLNATLQLVQRLAATGVQAIAVHCRTPDQRPREPGDATIFKHIVAAVGSKVSVIANGDIKTLADGDRLMRESGVDSVMLARAAQYDFCVFRRDAMGMEPLQRARAYIRYAVLYDNDVSNTKYCLQTLWNPLGDTMVAFRSCKTNEQLCEVVGMSDFYKQVMDQRQHLSMKPFDLSLYDGGR